MANYIDREAALEALSNPFTMSMCLSAEECKGMRAARDIDREIIKRIPAADVVEVRHGRWIGFPDCLKFPSAYSDDHIVCSICEECFSILDNDTERFDFCPNCGAKMEVDGE